MDPIIPEDSIQDSPSRFKRFKKFLVPGLLALALPLIISQVFVSQDKRQHASEIIVVRGAANDFLADVVIGKRDFAEISPREIVQYKLNSPGGAIVDRSVAPGRLYIWDSGNSRIVGIDLAKCYGQSGTCSADIVIGQPSKEDYGACNQDSSMQNYPHRAVASALTLCGVPDFTHTTLEDKSFTSMYVDRDGNIYVPDTRNNRVLKFISPFTTDTVADEVWGQDDFSGVYCNKTEIIENGTPNTSGGLPDPTMSSLCNKSTYSGGTGVTQDVQGNLWIADGGNNRVLRFPKDSQTNTIAKTADLVLGQTDFSIGPKVVGNGLQQMKSPNALDFGLDGELYVADGGNNRVLVFLPPFTTGMEASKTFGSNHSGMNGLQADPWGRGIWTYENVSWDAYARLWNFDGTLQQDLPKLGNNGGGSLGFDTEKNIIATTYVHGQDAHQLTLQVNGAYKITRQLFSPPGGYNLTTNRRLEHPAWAGVAVVGDQLIVLDGRFQFWNGLGSLTNGKAPDGQITYPNKEWIADAIKVDALGRVWVSQGHRDGWDDEIAVYQAPLTSNSTPIKTITFPLNVLGGGQIVYTRENVILSVAPSPDGKFLWISQPRLNRVLRIRDPLTNPVVDVVIGQKSLSETRCNQGSVVPPAQNSGRPASEDATLNMLCSPGAISLDKKGNLYISDHFIEAEGNWRLLMYSPSLIPADLSSVLYALNATKEFPRSRSTNPQSHATFETAFDSQNRMVVGYNPYLGPRFLEYYNDPTKLNAANPADPAYAVSDGQFKDFYSWSIAMTFDSLDNLYAYDANRGQVRIYKHPFALPTNTPTPGPTATATPTPTPILIATPTPTKIPTSTPTPVDRIRPTVSITSPSKNSFVVRSKTTTITATAFDASGITKVEFYVSGAIKCTDITAPYACAWVVPAPIGRSYSLTAKAYDPRGNNKTSDRVTVISF